MSGHAKQNLCFLKLFRKPIVSDCTVETNSSVCDHQLKSSFFTFAAWFQRYESIFITLSFLLHSELTSITLIKKSKFDKGSLKPISTQKKEGFFRTYLLIWLGFLSTWIKGDILIRVIDGNIEGSEKCYLFFQMKYKSQYFSLSYVALPWELLKKPKISLLRSIPWYEK